MKALVLFLALAMLTLVGCKHSGATRPDGGDPAPLAQCADSCYEPCVKQVGTDANGQALYDTGVRWEGDPNQPATTDALGGDVLEKLVGKLIACEVRGRQACVTCLNRLEQAGALRQ